MKLAVVSHTGHYSGSNQTIYGWAPTVREINHLAKEFDEVFHVACLLEGDVPPGYVPYEASNISFIPLPPSGGKSLTEKFSVLTHAPTVIRTVLKIIEQADAIQFRVPTGMANYLLPYFSVHRLNIPVFVKYAGNWQQPNAPAGYRFQKWWLEKNFLKCKVTINGKWNNQPAHCLSFENPCLDDFERLNGAAAVNVRKFDLPYTACFVGRMEVQKGLNRIISAIPELSMLGVDTIHFIGDGKDRMQAETSAASQNLIRCEFHGNISRDRLPEILNRSHLILLPSDSEGFPKVIAEAANYGVVPLVSDVSSIGQYINASNGFLWDTRIDFREWLRGLQITGDDLISKSRQLHQMAELFTYSRYLKRIKTELLNDH